MQITTGKIPLGDVLVYEYGLRLDKECIDSVQDQIGKSRRLYNDLIAVMRTIVQEMQAHVLDHAGAPARAAQQQVESLNADFAAAKAANDEESMRTIAQERRLAWRELADSLKETRKTLKAELQKNYLARIGKNTGTDTYNFRCKAVADGLGWATANVILDAALIAFKKTFVKGRAPQFSIGAEKDQDTLTLQFTAAGGVDANTILTGGNSELTMLPTNGCGPRKYGEFRFRLGPASIATYATGTWQYHRPLPEKSAVGLARIVRRKIGKDTKWALQLMIKLPESLHEKTEQRLPLVAIHFGWAADINGRRIAGIADSAEPGNATVLQLPPDIETDLNRAAEIQATRDKARDEAVQVLKASELPDSAPNEIEEEFAAIRKLPAQHVAISRLQRFARRLSEHGVGLLEVWRKKDRLQWQDATHIAKRARNRRRDFYRNTAISLARRYEAVTIEPLDLQTAAKKIDETTGEKTEFAKKARAGRVVAALYEFESAIRWACAKTGSALLELSGDTASGCTICGGAVEEDKENGQLLHCAECSAVLDRKQNGAAAAWQAASLNVADLVENFWLEIMSERQKKTEAKSEKLRKMVEGRRQARTANDGATPEGSRKVWN